MGERLKDRVAIVTGAGRGIGRGVALLLAEEGASVVVNDLGANVDGTDSSAGPADEVVAEIRSAGGTAVANHDSVATFDGAGEIVNTAIANYGKVDILCHVAGILRDRMIFNMAEEGMGCGAGRSPERCVQHRAAGRPSHDRPKLWPDLPFLLRLRPGQHRPG